MSAESVPLLRPAVPGQAMPPTNDRKPDTRPPAPDDTATMPAVEPATPAEATPAESSPEAPADAESAPAAPAADAEPAPEAAAAAQAPEAPPVTAPPTATPPTTGAAPSTAAALDELAESLRPAILGVPGQPDQDEVAAALEDAGVTDQSARQSFGQPDLFALAGRLLPRLARPRRPANADLAPLRQAPPPRRHAVAPLRLDLSGLLALRLAPARLAGAAGLVAAAWWLRAPAAAVLPAVAAVPLAELLLAWRLGYARWGLGYHDSATGWRGHLRRTGRLTLIALAVPLLLAAGLAGAASHVSRLVPVATGLLAAGGYPLLLLFTARRRFLAGASLIALTVAGTVLTHPSLPRMGVLAGGYVAGLALTAYVLLDPRSRD